MRLDDLIDQSIDYETVQTGVDRRVTLTARIALAGCAGSTLVYTGTSRNTDTTVTGWIVDWFGNPTIGYSYTFLTLIVGIVLFAFTSGFNKANLWQHQLLVGFTIAAATTTIPIMLAVILWIMIVVFVVAMFALSIGFWILLLWAFTQVN